MTTATTPRRCPACRCAYCYKGYYLCFDCWGVLPLAARRALKRSDLRAMARLQELYQQIRRHVPLDKVRITP